MLHCLLVWCLELSFAVPVNHKCSAKSWWCNSSKWWWRCYNNNQLWDRHTRQTKTTTNRRTQLRWTIFWGSLPNPNGLKRACPRAKIGKNLSRRVCSTTPQTRRLSRSCPRSRSNNRPSVTILATTMTISNRCRSPKVCLKSSNLLLRRKWHRLSKPDWRL